MKNLVLLNLYLFLLTGCIHKASPLPVTPWERTMTDNAMLAQFVDTAEQGTELANTSGALSDDTARPVISFEQKFADTHEKITAVLKLGPAADLSQANALLEAFKAEAQALIASGEIGVKNPKTQLSITGDLNNAVALAEALLADITLIRNGVNP